MKTVSNSLGLVETGPENSGDLDTEDTFRSMGFPIDKSLELGKNEEGIIFKKRIYKGKKTYVATFDTNYLQKNVIKKT